MNPLDRSLFHAINDWPATQRGFWIFLSTATELTWVRVALLLLIIGLLSFKLTRIGGFVSAVAWMLANESTDILKAAIPFPRPYNVEGFHDVIVRTGRSDSMGTASAHSANMMCVGVCFTLFFGWWGVPWLVLAILVGISRVYVGAHFPSQVLFGWLVGAAVAFAAWGLVRLIQGWAEARRPKPDPA
ncbi:MAG: phosphatase PAP2 family protein [Fimbriimonadaceae bacterium]|nr:phosphatase PAP2 family protein [Fimbriimonadaceae bacterium]